MLRCLCLCVFALYVARQFATHVDMPVRSCCYVRCHGCCHACSMPWLCAVHVDTHVPMPRLLALQVAMPIAIAIYVHMPMRDTMTVAMRIPHVSMYTSLHVANHVTMPTLVARYVATHVDLPMIQVATHVAMHMHHVAMHMPMTRCMGIFVAVIIDTTVAMPIYIAIHATTYQTTIYVPI